jgi:hypothetical protein
MKIKYFSDRKRRCGTGNCFAPKNVFDCLGRSGTVPALLARLHLVLVCMYEMEGYSLVVPREAAGVLKNSLRPLAFDGHVRPVCR